MDALLPQLPGAGELDEALVARAAADITRIYEVNGLRTYLEVGRYILDTFFDGDAHTFEERAGGHVSFRELARQPDMPFGHDHLSKSVRVVQLVERLPPTTASRLTMTHHVRLLSVRDPDKRLELAQQAAAEQWSTRELEEQVRKVVKPTKQGRPRKPAVVKALARITKALEAAVSEPFSQLQLSDEVLMQLVDQIDRAIVKLQELRHDLVRSVPGR